ncbi:MAG: hypothetical protein ABSC65_30380, partial [Acidobacteriaceae bacterium]
SDQGTDGTTPNEIGRGWNGSASKDKARHASTTVEGSSVRNLNPPVRFSGGRLPCAPIYLFAPG